MGRPELTAAAKALTGCAAARERSIE